MTFTGAKWWVGSLAATTLIAASTLTPHAGRAAGEKLRRILDERLRAAEVVTFSDHEVNSFLAFEPPPEIPAGVSNVRVQILEDAGMIDADVDLERVQAAAGSRPNLLLRLLLNGERHVSAVCRFTSDDGLGTIEVESVDIDGTVLRGPLLDWVIEQYVVPRVPEFQPGEPIALPNNLKMIRLEQGRASVYSY